MQNRRNSLSLAPPGCLCLIYASSLVLISHCARAEEYSTLPAAPRALPTVSNATFYLTIVVNGQTDNQVVPVLYRNNSYFVESGVLSKNHVRTNGQQQGLVDVGALPDVTVTYQSAAQQLQITVPSDWLPKQDLKGENLINYVPAQSSTGLMFNYDSYYNDPYRGQSSLATWMEQRLFSNVGILSNTGTWRYNFNDEGTSRREDNSGQDGYIRYDTYWRYSDEKNLISYQVGDFVSDSLTWSNSARMGGLRISRNFAVRPDVVTYPLMQFSGIAAVPTTVDLFINGYKASSNNLNSGPFTLTNVPYINGAGEATVVTTDALGRQVSTNVPFYVANELLRSGLSDFDFSVGKVRQNYGISNNDYSDLSFSGIYRYGLSDYLTLSGHGEATSGLTLGGLGADISVGNFGTLSLSTSKSQADRRPVGNAIGNNSGIPGSSGQEGITPDIRDNIFGFEEKQTSGNQYTLGYSYYSNLFSLSALRSSRTEGYQDLTSYTSNTRLSRQSDQATFSAPLFGQGNGTVGIGYFDVEAYDQSHTRLVNLSYSRSLWGQSSLFLSLNKTLNENGYSAQLQFIIPLDFGVSINAGIQRNNAGNYREQVGASKNAPTEGGLGWNLAYSGDRGKNSYQQADATWKSRHGTIQGGVYGESGKYTNWADLSGSIVLIDKDIFLSDKINDAFVLVSTDNYPGVPVTYENQKLGKTDRQGHLLIPAVSSYYPAKIDIDTLPLPINIVAPKVSDKVSVREGSGVVIDFPVKKVLSANIKLHDSQGQPLPIGTQVTEQNSQQTTVVGYGGLAYLTNLQKNNILNVHQADNSTCQIAFEIDENNQSIAQIGPLICRTSVTTKEGKNEIL